MKPTTPEERAACRTALQRMISHTRTRGDTRRVRPDDLPAEARPAATALLRALTARPRNATPPCARRPPTTDLPPLP